MLIFLRYFWIEVTFLVLLLPQLSTRHTFPEGFVLRVHCWGSCCLRRCCCGTLSVIQIVQWIAFAALLNACRSGRGGGGGCCLSFSIPLPASPSSRRDDSSHTDWHQIVRQTLQVLLLANWVRDRLVVTQDFQVIGVLGEKALQLLGIKDLSLELCCSQFPHSCSSDASVHVLHPVSEALQFLHVELQGRRLFARFFFDPGGVTPLVLLLLLSLVACSC
mmetsp:Transcript_9025/g.15002  ORF Transcript_9025/g.15002 Transcript_9025/m.15002 type:complete len:219 (-) Transcript_9025:96-752(-)